jgi:hypothetical protein
MVKQAKAGQGSMSSTASTGTASGASGGGRGASMNSNGNTSDDDSDTSSNGGHWAKKDSDRPIGRQVRAGGNEAKNVPSAAPRPMVVPMVGGVKLTSDPSLLQDAEKVIIFLLLLLYLSFLFLFFYLQFFFNLMFESIYIWGERRLSISGVSGRSLVASRRTRRF